MATPDQAGRNEHAGRTPLAGLPAQARARPHTVETQFGPIEGKLAVLPDGGVSFSPNSRPAGTLRAKKRCPAQGHLRSRHASLLTGPLKARGRVLAPTPFSVANLFRRLSLKQTAGLFICPLFQAL